MQHEASHLTASVFSVKEGQGVISDTGRGGRGLGRLQGGRELTTHEQAGQWGDVHRRRRLWRLCSEGPEEGGRAVWPDGCTESQVREVGTDDMGRVTGNGTMLGGRRKPRGHGAGEGPLQEGLGEADAGEAWAPQKGRRQAGVSPSEGDLGSSVGRNSTARNSSRRPWSRRDLRPPLAPKMPLGRLLCGA